MCECVLYLKHKVIKDLSAKRNKRKNLLVGNVKNINIFCVVNMPYCVVVWLAGGTVDEDGVG